MRIPFIYALLGIFLSHVAAAEIDRATIKQSSTAEANAPTRFIIQHRADAGSRGHEDVANALHSMAPQLRRAPHSAGNQMEVWSANSTLDSSTTQRILESLRSRSDVQFVAIDHRRHAHALPSDPLFTNQWYLQNTQPAAIAANTAWDLTKGSATVVVAVLDTGVRFDHPDLAGKLLPGYDFVSADSNGGFLTANDGDGWDADASDPGDWISNVDKQQSIFSDCTVADSSWHGTRVAGMIGAATDNAVGIAGAAWNTMILPVRVLGKCGGYDSDIITAMKWAAGLHISGVPDNANPAKIINLSLGGAGACSAAYRSVIQQLNAMGVAIFVSAGNEGGPVDEPANCAGVVGVAGLRHIGTKVGYSSLGTEISIAAPAGNCVNLSGPCLNSLDTTYNTGTTVPAASNYTDQFNTNLGTSFSAPLAASVAALMRAVNPQLSAAQLRLRMMEGAVAFPAPGNNIPVCHVPTGSTDVQNTECGCTTSTCGAGMLNAHNAVVAAQRPIIDVTLPPLVTPNASITLDASATTASSNRSIASYAWTTVTACNVATPTLTVNNQSSLILNAPSFGSYTIRLQVTDTQGASDSTDITVTTNGANIASAPACVAATAPTATPAAVATSSNSGGGGGNLSIYFLLTILALSCAPAMRAAISE